MVASTELSEQTGRVAARAARARVVAASVFCPDDPCASVVTKGSAVRGAVRAARARALALALWRRARSGSLQRAPAARARPALACSVRATSTPRELVVPLWAMKHHAGRVHQTKAVYRLQGVGGTAPPLGGGGTAPRLLRSARRDGHKQKSVRRNSAGRLGRSPAFGVARQHFGLRGVQRGKARAAARRARSRQLTVATEETKCLR